MILLLHLFEKFILEFSLRLLDLIQQQLLVLNFDFQILNDTLFFTDLLNHLRFDFLFLLSLLLQNCRLVLCYIII